MSNDDLGVLNAKLDTLHGRIGSMESSLSKLAEAMVSIARLEVRLAGNGDAVNRAFESIEKLSTELERHSFVMDERIKKLEETAPINKLISGWVLAWIAGAVGIVGGAVASKVVGL